MKNLGYCQRKYEEIEDENFPECITCNKEMSSNEYEENEGECLECQFKKCSHCGDEGVTLFKYHWKEYNAGFAKRDQCLCLDCLKSNTFDEGETLTVMEV